MAVSFAWYTCCLLLHLLILKEAAATKCQPSFPCKNYTLEFPFTLTKHPQCGLFLVDGCDTQHEHPKFHVGPCEYSILNRLSGNRLLIHDMRLQYFLDHKPNNCTILKNIPLFKNSTSVSFTFFSPNLTLFQCSKRARAAEHFRGYTKQECQVHDVYYKVHTDHVVQTSTNPTGCSAVQLPKSNQDSGDMFNLLAANFTLEWKVSEACSKCYNEGGQCLTDNQNQFYCSKDTTLSLLPSDHVQVKKSRLKLLLALSVSGAGLLLLLSITFQIWQRYKNNFSRIISSYTSTKQDIESAGGVFYFGIPVFSFNELEEATNNFDPSKQLGDGAFGTVYHGKLRDGREVAIKRMYEHNMRRVEQFLNEIKILTSLTHPNLVSLYGCTSRTSRELLLVYEYIPNGTVADHLHGDRVDEAPLSWPLRMSIAIETATALAYLHKSDIIHRDVKTNNILLDSNFSVKVADFGLSRLFPYNVTHISTAPQGTPGYVDPEYHQCYQLTDKSDVYSFGVVLIELISSMPAVDISRHRNEVNLANLAMSRIRRGAFDDLIDPYLGYDSDAEVTRMSTMVAELAFRCLQVDKDLRPTMNEVLDFLTSIEGGEG